MGSNPTASAISNEADRFTAVGFMIYSLKRVREIIALRRITKENYEECFALKVADSQMDFVPSNVYSLAQAWIFIFTSFPFAIYDDNTMGRVYHVRIL